ncbi:MAG: citramalate synthase [Phycisphaeraceae bacterium]|nr:citramalate synthase [Phycisphaeraceae bacterium]
MTRRIEMYDTTLRDGTQAEGFNLSLVDKLKIAQMLDELGFDYIEGGYPLSNPKDAAFFEEAGKLTFKHAKLCAFGMTRRKGVQAEEDTGMKALVAAKTPVITIVGKTWDLHVKQVLDVSEQENLDMIRESVAFCAKHGSGGEVFYDAEHFFDGYKANPDYALQTLQAALDGGATRLVLCDTNGGSLPNWISLAVNEVKVKSEKWKVKTDGLLAVHPHNDSAVAVANALAAVEAGCVQVQGTINGIGERCGTGDLIPVVANRTLKMGHECLVSGAEMRLTELSRYVYEIANLNLQANQPYVGTSAFAHKGGMHVHAVQKLARSYEHVPPESVGNTRRVLVSELAGASNVVAMLGRKYDISEDKKLQRMVLERVQDLENRGYQFEAAEASFELLLLEVLGKRRSFWELDHYRCVILKRNGEPCGTEAIVKLTVNGRLEHHVAEGDGPINALDGALRKGLEPHYPQLGSIHLTDYKVRVVNPTAESAAKVRVIIDFAVRQKNGQGSVVRRFSTTGVNENIVDASWEALSDAFTYFLIETPS